MFHGEAPRSSWCSLCCSHTRSATAMTLVGRFAIGCWPRGLTAPHQSSFDGVGQSGVGGKRVSLESSHSRCCCEGFVIPRSCSNCAFRAAAPPPFGFGGSFGPCFFLGGLIAAPSRLAQDERIVSSVGSEFQKKVENSFSRKRPCAKNALRKSVRGVNAVSRKKKERRLPCAALGNEFSGDDNCLNSHGVTQHFPRASGLLSCINEGFEPDLLRSARRASVFSMNTMP